MSSHAGSAPPRGGPTGAAVESAALVLLGGLAGLSMSLLPGPARELVSTTLTGSAVVASSAVVLVEQRRRRARHASEGRPAPEDTTTFFLLSRPWVRRAYGVVMGLLLAQLALIADSLVVLAAVVLAGALVTASIAPLVSRSRRRQRSAAATAHPGAAVVLVAMVDLASLRLAQWAKAGRATLPAELGGAGVLVADADGVALHRSGRPARLVHRWPWDDVELTSGPHPDDPEARVLVLTLLGPQPAPRARAVPLGRRRFDVTLAVRDGVMPAGRSVVDAAIVALSARRPHPGTGSEIATAVEVG